MDKFYTNPDTEALFFIGYHYPKLDKLQLSRDVDGAVNRYFYFVRKMDEMMMRLEPIIEINGHVICFSRYKMELNLFEEYGINFRPDDYDTFGFVYSYDTKANQLEQIVHNSHTFEWARIWVGDVNGTMVNHKWVEQRNHKLQKIPLIFDYRELHKDFIDSGWECAAMWM